MTSQLVWSRQARLSPGDTSVVRAREFVGAELEAHNLTYLVDKVELVVSEFVTHAVDRTHSSIGVRLEEQLFCVRLTVDCGSSAATIPAAGSSDEWGRSVRGVDRAAADWGMGTAQNGDTFVWALFEMRAPSYESWAHPTTSTRDGRPPTLNGSAGPG